MRERKEKTERRKEYQREWLRRKRAEQKKEAEAKRDPLDLNIVGEKGNEPIKGVPLSWEEFKEENPDKSKTDWVKYKINFSTQQAEEDWKAEPKAKPKQQNSQVTFPSFDNMLENSGQDKAGW
jgi:hypothetical protein